MSSDGTPLSELDVGARLSVVDSIGPYNLHLDVEKQDDGTFEVFGKGVEQTRTVLLNSDMLGPVANAIHNALYAKLVRDRYDVGTVISRGTVQSMRIE